MALQTKELKNLQDILAEPVGPDCCDVPLFHGTRAYALQVAEADRKRFHTACDKVMTFAKSIFWTCPVNDDALLEYQRSENSLFMSSVVYQYKTAKYDYGAFYLTSGYPNAFIFANFAGGELGEFAYGQCRGFRHFNIDLEPEVAAAATVVEAEYEKYANSEKLILVYRGVRYRDMATESGFPFLKADGTLDAFLIEDMEDIICKDGWEYAPNYRLANPEGYTGWIIRQKDFKTGLSVFTQIRDVEKYIRWNHLKL